MKHFKTLTPLTFGAIALLSLQACSPSNTPSSANTSTPTLQGKLVLTGSSTVAPLLSEIGKRYESKHSGVRIDVQSGGSSRGIADARQGVADIGMISRDLKESERDLQSFTVARDGISVIVHKENSIASLSDRQIVDIYTKKVDNWKQVGGKDAPIIVVNKAEGRSTLELFAQFFKLKTTEIKADVVIGDNEQGIKTIAGNPNAIGYVSIGSAEYSANNGVAIKLLPMNGVEAAIVNVANKTFPISRPLNLVTKVPPTAPQKDFIDFARSPEVNDLVKAQYFVPIQ
ncbi:phosphate ABC transporter substrate-binding protein [Pseudanabaena galeata UHCC 0370]|uniref:Phosphate ABC transporter substrate-binding protein n=1 Tax=Pseudanabaena galeata UHCC 0370 TaxID=3110310 RepID=A0ABU5TQI1_9CYAN|nr:phosphate ABC transporter substrate-binding protein [Pseudanabaena galeata]MEA5480405.1 phosphate ABC transporter substrate-binding protein [Pseudanabaena galeata UHCC 0370]